MKYLITALCAGALLVSCFKVFAGPPEIQFRVNSVANTSKVEFKLASFDAQASMYQTKWVRNDEDQSLIFVALKPIITNNDILGASITNNSSECGNGFGVHIFIRPDKDALLQQFSDEHIGDNLALIVNDNVEGVIQIRSTLKSPAILMCDPSASAEQAKHLAQLVTGQRLSNNPVD